MSWHKGNCAICQYEKLVGKVECLGIEVCKECLINSQNQRIENERINKCILN